MQSGSAKPAITSTESVTRGAMRLLLDMGYAPITEVSLTNRRRADILGLDRKGRAVIVEVKSCAADFQSDSKWREYLLYCEAFYFAVDADFPRSLLATPESLPDIAGLIVGDAYGADILRPAALRTMNAARKRALTLRAARTGAQRLASASLMIGGL